MFAGDTIFEPNYNYISSPSVFINGVKADSAVYIYNPYYQSSDSFWLGNVCIVDSSYSEYDPNTIGNIINYLTCIIYIQAGDSVAVIDSPGELNRIFYSPDTVWEIQDGGEGPVYWYNQFTIIVQYLPDSISAIQNIQPDKQLAIYPNPTTGLLNFTNYYPTNGTAGVEIFDVSGWEVIQQNFEVTPGLQTNPINMGNLPNGVYLVQYTVNGNRKMEKVVKM